MTIPQEDLAAELRSRSIARHALAQDAAGSEMVGKTVHFMRPTLHGPQRCEGRVVTTEGTGKFVVDTVGYGTFTVDPHETVAGDETQRQGKDQDPKLALDPPVSEKQRRAMYAAASGHSTLGIPKKVGEEFVGKAR